MALILNISILQLKLKRDLVKRKLKKFGMVIKLKKKTGDLNSPISPISKTSFFGEGFKNDSTTEREIENE